jgi:hypothetical protein
MVLLTGDHDHMGCFADQGKLTCALVRDLDEAVREVKLLGEHEEESSQKIMELEALCKKLREDTQRLEEEKATLEGMVELAMSYLWRSLGRLDWTTWEKMTRMRRRMPTTEMMLPHHLLLHQHLLCPLLPHLGRSKMKALCR